MTKPRASAFCLLLVLGGMVPWPASLALERQTTPLARFMLHAEPIRLRNVADDYRLAFPVPERYQILQAELGLDFIHSNALVPPRSQLRVQINGVTVAQWHPAPDRLHRSEVIRIPPELLVPGYNELRFQAAQHYTDQQCEAAVSPELWTEINPLTSHLDFSYRLRPTPLSLAHLSALFDKKLPEATVRLLFAGPALGDAELGWGGLIAQGIGLRLDYAPFRLELGQATASTADGPVRLAAPGDRDLVLVGIRDRIAAFLDPGTRDHINGPYLGLFPAPGNPQRFVLVVSGTDRQEVEQAAWAFSRLNFPLPDAGETVIYTTRLEPPVPYQGLPALAPDHAYRFRQLGFATTSRTGLYPPPIEVGFHLPPDLFAPEDAEVVFRLHLAYAAGMRRDSLLEMRINDIFEHAIPLPEASGAHYRDYRIAVPLRTFRPGFNRITLHPLPVPAVSGECLHFQTRNLTVTVYDDSSIQLPPAVHYAELPDLSLLARSGFPYLTRADGSGLGIQLLNRRPDTILAAWHLIAKLARLNRLPLDRAALGFAPVSGERDVIVIGGHVRSLEGAVFQHAPVRPAGPGWLWHYPAGKALDEPEVSWWRTLLARFRPSPDPFPAPLATRHAAIGQTGGLGRLAMGLSFPRPDVPKRLVTAFVADGDLYPAIRALTHPGLWSQLQGNLVVWRPDSKTLAWQRLGGTFYVGTAGPGARLAFHFARHPWQWLLAGLAAIALFTWLSHFLLRRFRRRHHSDVEEIAP